MKQLFCFIFLAILPFLYGAPDNQGKEFIIGYMENLGTTLNVELFVTSVRTTTVNVRVQTPYYVNPSTGQKIDESFTVTAGYVKQIFFPPSIRMAGNAKSNKAIWITADDEVVIYGVNKETYSCDAFLGLPTDVLGKEYYAMTYYPASQQCEMLVVGVNDTTTVSIKFSNSLVGSISYGGSSYSAGQTLTTTVNRFDTLHLAIKGELTGTYITSDHPISVFSGNKKTKIGAGGSSDHLVEQMVPVDNWGKNFITVPVPLRTTGDFFRFVASEANTNVVVSGGMTLSFNIANPGDFVEQAFDSSAYTKVTSDKPILLVQFCLSQQSSAEPSDPMMMIIPPVEQFGADYTFATPKYSQGSYTNYFMFIVKESAKDGLKLDGASFTPATGYNAIPGTDFVGGYVLVSDGSHVMRHDSPISVFGGYLYGQATYETYGFSTGMRMAPINTVCVPTTSAVGDGVDNDCDGLIDEELCTPANGGADDDGDGRTDEDCAKPSPIDGMWADWQAWGPCSMTCLPYGTSDTGNKTRERTCTNPPPQYDGKQCVGDGIEVDSCTVSTYCAVDGVWSDWGQWGACTKSCGAGQQSRSRSCDNPLPQFGGAQCSGDSSEFKDCNLGVCPTASINNYVQTCPGSMFTCLSGTPNCIDMTNKCDCEADCADQSDESDTYAGCDISICAAKLMGGGAGFATASFFLMVCAMLLARLV